MTEDESHAKLCSGPAPHNTGMAGNPDVQGIIRFYCSASLCMAWRWTEDYPGFKPDQVSVHDGYCGIAGKP